MLRERSFRDGVECSLKIETEVVGLSCLDKVVVPFRLPIVYSRSPILSEVCNYTMMLRNYEFTVDKLYFRVARASVSILPDISQFYQGVPVIDRIKNKAAEFVEPFLLEIMLEFITRLAAFVFDVKRLGKDEACALANTSGNMGIRGGISVDIVEHLSVWTLYADSLLPSLAPFLDITLGKSFGGALKLGYDMLGISAGCLVGEDDVAELGMQQPWFTLDARRMS